MRAFLVALCLAIICACIPGPAGPQGLPGNTGSPGATISSAKNCFVINSLYFSYEFVQFSDGSAFVQCEINDRSSVYGSSQMFRPGAAGAVSGGCLVTYDIDTPNAGFWIFGMVTGSPLLARATYSDSSSPSSGRSYDMPCTAQ